MLPLSASDFDVLAHPAEIEQLRFLITARTWNGLRLETSNAIQHLVYIGWNCHINAIRTPCDDPGMQIFHLSFCVINNIMYARNVITLIKIAFAHVSIDGGISQSDAGHGPLLDLAIDSMCTVGKVS